LSHKTHPLAEKPPTCTKCGEEMQSGFVMSPSRSLVGIVLNPNLAEWHANPAELGVVNWKLSKEKHPIRAYRCTQCGFLEFYAK
jgi:predicted Zn-ribbon and HTH transcriptional regulator